jgi:hypothetical protein
MSIPRTDGVKACPATKEDFPYDRTFRAIAAATKIEGAGIGVSVKAFIEAWNAYGVNACEPKHCKPCNQTGLAHCQHPDECGGPWDKRNDGVALPDGGQRE